MFDAARIIAVAQRLMPLLRDCVEKSSLDIGLSITNKELVSFMRIAIIMITNENNSFSEILRHCLSRTTPML